MIIRERKLSEIWDELQPMLYEHWKELANYQDIRPLDPDKERYIRMNELDLLKILTYEVDGKILGYCSFIVTENLHYKTWKQAVSDVYYLDPSLRKTSASLDFFKAILHWLKEMGVRGVIVQDKINHSHENFFKKLGFTPVEQVYEKVI